MNILRKVLLISTLSVITLTLVQAEQGPKEEITHSHKLYQAAKDGDAEVQYQLGVILLHGLDGLQGSVDEKEALKWLRESAAAGHRGAQYYIGEIYQYGLAGVTPDGDQALQWYQKSAAQGHVLAQTMVKHLAEQKDQPSPSASPSSNPGVSK